MIDLRFTRLETQMILGTLTDGEPVLPFNPRRVYLRIAPSSANGFNLWTKNGFDTSSYQLFQPYQFLELWYNVHGPIVQSEFYLRDFGSFSYVVWELIAERSIDQLFGLAAKMPYSKHGGSIYRKK